MVTDGSPLKGPVMRKCYQVAMSSYDSQILQQSDNGLVPVWHQTIIWTYDGILFI